MVLYCKGEQEQIFLAYCMNLIKIRKLHSLFKLRLCREEEQEGQLRKKNEYPLQISVYYQSNFTF